MAVEMIIKWLVCFVFSINIAQAEFFASEVLATPKSLSLFKANIIATCLDCDKGGRGIVNLRAWFPDVRYLEVVLH